MQPLPYSSTELSAFEAAIERLETCGFMLARLETLMKAVRDKGLDRTCLLVLAVLIEHMNKETLTTWIGRKAIADSLGISEKTVSNCLWRLNCLGYIVSARLPTPQANNRVMQHHTLSALSPEELEAAIARAVSSIRGEKSTVVPFPTSRPTGNSTPETSRPDGKPVPAPTGTSDATSRSNGNTEAASSRPDGCSNSNNKTTTVGATGEGAGEGGETCSARPQPKKRATCLPDDWYLPQSWGEWALAQFEISVGEVRREAARFKDYWTGLGDVARARKGDWLATWRNWIRKNYQERTPDTDVAPNLTAPGDNLHETLARMRAEEGIVDR